MTRIALRVLLLLACPGSAFATASIIGPAPERVRLSVRAFEVGFWASGSNPTGSSRAGIDPSYKAGASLTWMRTPSAGIGLALDYCRWRSPATGEAFDRLFTAFSQSPIRGTEATLSGLRATMFVKQEVPIPGPVVPWLRVGAGACRTNSKLVFPAAQLQNAGWTVSSSGTRTVSYDPMLVGGVGFDVRATGSMKLGLDLTYEVIYAKDTNDPVTALMFGGHVLFGYWSPGR